MAPVRNYTEAFEPEAERALSPEHAALVSIAISLKRIADTMDGIFPPLTVSLGDDGKVRLSVGRAA